MTLQEYNYLEQIKIHYLTIKKLEQQIKKHPKGCLVKHQKGKYTTLYVHISENGEQTRKYLSPKKDASLISALQKKQTELPALRKQLAFHKSALKSMKTYGKKLIRTITFTKQNTEPFFSENTIEPKKLKYTTNRGEKVRSKSEKIIADLLFEYKIDYKYEKSLKLHYYSNIYPDFTIVSPLSNQTYFREHNGLDTEEYLDHWKTKKQVYEHSNITTDNRLIVTTEEDIDNFRNIIEQNFTLKRYDFIFTI